MDNRFQNPWLDVSADSYDRHMSHDDVGQAQVLSRIAARKLKEYQPRVLAVLGVATGNGLEHVDRRVTRQIFAIDINRRYLAQCSARYGRALPGLRLVLTDINSQTPQMREVDLYLAALVLEYVDMDAALKKIRLSLKTGGILNIVIQKNGGSDVVSRSPYAVALKRVEEIAVEIGPDVLVEKLETSGFAVIRRKEHPLPNGKTLIDFDCRKI